MEGIHIARAALGMRTSFMVWFVDHLYAFDLAAAIHREHGELKDEQAQLWATRLIKVAMPYLRKCQLISPEGDESVPNAVAASHGEGLPKTSLLAGNKTAKRMLLITWSEPLHTRSVQWVQEMQRVSGSSDGSDVMCELKISHLDTASPCVKKL